MQGAEAPLIVADGGASASAPEHTIAAFEGAVAEGADGLWLDVHCSRDHHPVVIRDFTLERTTDGAGPVGDHDLRALKRLDAGRWRGTPFVGQRLQSLEEVLERFRDRARFVCALRGGLACYPEIAERVVGLVDIYGVVDRCLLMSFDRPTLDAARGLHPDLPLGRLFAQAPVPAPDGVQAVGLEAHRLTRETSAELSARGVACYAMAVSDPARALVLAGWGVRAIVTGRPGAVRARLGR